MIVQRTLLLLLTGSLAWISCSPQCIAPENVAAEPRLTENLFISFDGTGLPLRTWLPAGKAEAVIIALHGYNDYSAFIRDAAGYFTGRGIAVHAYDQRGFGAAPHRGKWAGHEAMGRDLRTFIGLIRERHPRVPLFLLGDSMGGAVIMAAESTENPLPVDGFILVAPAVWSRMTMPFYQRWALRLGACIFPWVRVSPEHLDITPSDNREMLKALARDPLMIRKSRIDALSGLADLMDAAYAAAGSFDRNMLLLYGAKDEIIPPRPMIDVFRQRIGGRFANPQRLLVYANGYHMLLRDLQGKVVWEDIVTWINAPAGPFPSVRNRLAREINGEEDIAATLHPGQGR